MGGILKKTLFIMICISLVLPVYAARASHCAAATACAPSGAHAMPGPPTSHSNNNCPMHGAGCCRLLADTSNVSGVFLLTSNQDPHPLEYAGPCTVTLQDHLGRPYRANAQSHLLTRRPTDRPLYFQHVALLC